MLPTFTCDPSLGNARALPSDPTRPTTTPYVSPQSINWKLFKYMGGINRRPRRSVCARRCTSLCSPCVLVSNSMTRVVSTPSHLVRSAGGRVCASWSPFVWWGPWGSQPQLEPFRSNRLVVRRSCRGCLCHVVGAWHNIHRLQPTRTTVGKPHRTLILHTLNTYSLSLNILVHCP